MGSGTECVGKNLRRPRCGWMYFWAKRVREAPWREQLNRKSNVRDNGPGRSCTDDPDPVDGSLPGHRCPGTLLKMCRHSRAGRNECSPLTRRSVFTPFSDPPVAVGRYGLPNAARGFSGITTYPKAELVPAGFPDRRFQHSDLYRSGPLLYCLMSSELAAEAVGIRSNPTSQEQN